MIPLSISPSLRRIGAWLWLGLVVLVIFGSLSPRFGPPGAMHADKLLHALAYGILTGMPFAVFCCERTVIVVAALMLPMGFGLELAQDFVPTRMADAADALANVIGVAIGAALGPWGRHLANLWLTARDNRAG
jgi:VanZ family protein